MTAVVIVAPTDAQLAYIRSLCVERGHEFPPAVHSKAEASEIIEAIGRGQYDHRHYAPSHLAAEYGYDDLDPEWSDDDVPF